MDLTETLTPHVASRAVPGVAALVARGDEVVDVAMLGTAAFGDEEPLRRDAIFRAFGAGPLGPRLRLLAQAVND